MSSSTKIDNKKKHILILGKGPTQGLEHKKYILLFLLKIIKNPVWACVIMQRTVIYLLMVDKFINLKQRILASISKDWTVDNMKKTGLNGYAYDFSADYDGIAVDNILDIHKYLVKKDNMI